MMSAECVDEEVESYSMSVDSDLVLMWQVLSAHFLDHMVSHFHKQCTRGNVAFLVKPSVF